MEGYTNTISIPITGCTPERLQAVCDEINQSNRIKMERWEADSIASLEAQIAAVQETP